ncbi:MAG: hypothetical protein M3380_04330 [Chloroflexota bacterium]|nr:hypothetical protein [Chloroflexota bacterium]
MFRRPIARTVAQGIVAVGILLSMLLAGGAPSDFPYGKRTTSTQVER